MYRTKQHMSDPIQLSDVGSVSVTVVDAVADAADIDPEQVPVLQNVVDVDALRKLVAPPNRAPTSDVVVRFELAGCTVEASSSGTVTAVQNGSARTDAASDGVARETVDAAEATAPLEADAGDR